MIEFYESRSGKIELVLESVGYGWVVGQKVVKTSCETGYNNDGVVIPMVHLDKELVKRVHLIGISVRQQFLDIVEKQYATLGFLDVIVPFVNKPLVINGVNHC